MKYTVYGYMALSGLLSCSVLVQCSQQSDQSIVPSSTTTSHVATSVDSTDAHHHPHSHHSFMPKILHEVHAIEQRMADYVGSKSSSPALTPGHSVTPNASPSGHRRSRTSSHSASSEDLSQHDPAHLVVQQQHHSAHQHHHHHVKEVKEALQHQLNVVKDKVRHAAVEKTGCYNVKPHQYDDVVSGLDADDKNLSVITQSDQNATISKEVSAADENKEKELKKEEMLNVQKQKIKKSKDKQETITAAATVSAIVKQAVHQSQKLEHHHSNIKEEIKQIMHKLGVVEHIVHNVVEPVLNEIINNPKMITAILTTAGVDQQLAQDITEAVKEVLSGAKKGINFVDQLVKDKEKYDAQKASKRQTQQQIAAATVGTVSTPSSIRVPAIASAVSTVTTSTTSITSTAGSIATPITKRFTTTAHTSLSSTSMYTPVTQSYEDQTEQELIEFVEEYENQETKGSTLTQDPVAKSNATTVASATTSVTNTSTIMPSAEQSLTSTETFVEPSVVANEDIVTFSAKQSFTTEVYGSDENSNPKKQLSNSSQIPVMPVSNNQGVEQNINNTTTPPTVTPTVIPTVTPTVTPRGEQSSSSVQTLVEQPTIVQNNNKQTSETTVSSQGPTKSPEGPQNPGSRKWKLIIGGTAFVVTLAGLIVMLHKYNKLPDNISEFLSKLIAQNPIVA